jgi:beta-glucosidase
MTTIMRRLLALCVASFALAVSIPLAAQQKIPASQASPNQEAAVQTEVLDSQQFLLKHIAPRKPAKDYSAAVEKLLSQMTLKEKVGQMTQLDILMVSDGHNQENRINPEKLKKAIAEYGVGSLLNVYDEALPLEQWHAVQTQIQAEAAKSRLKIPVLYGIDTIHGANYIQGATLFPQPIGMAATWDPELFLRTEQIAAAETRASGIPWTFSPILDIGRQPLWSRFYETYGEDVYLAKVMAVAAVRGYEGDDPDSPTQVSACLKHYVGYSFPRSGHDRTPALIPEITLREYFLPTFAEAVKAGAHSVMVDSGEVNGVPGHANHYLLTDVLRKELGFKGVVDSDWQDIKNLVTLHHYAATEKEATRMAIMAGIDMSMVPRDYSFSDLLVQLVNEGAVPMSRINEAVRRILTMKMQLGLFRDPLQGVKSGVQLGSPEAQQTALQAAHESIVLLKNSDKLLPLSSSGKILVTGPTADTLVPMNNGWTYTWQGSETRLYPKDKPTVLGAVQAKAGSTNVVYVPGASLNKELDIAAAVEAAKSADVVILCLGEMSYAEGPGNIDNLTLPEPQLRLAEQVAATGKPIVLVMVEGRPRIIHRIAGLAKAIVLAPNPGNEGGQAVVDVLFGDYNPDGKLPFTYPGHPDALLTYDHRFSEDPNGDPNSTAFQPEFQFGSGLSYTTFQYSDLHLSTQKMSEHQPLHISLTVKNTGDRAGKEVVQLYLTQEYASITPPVKRLKRFAKVSLAPAESKELTFTLERDDFTFIGPENKPVLEPGEFEITVGDLRQGFTMASGLKAAAKN